MIGCFLHRWEKRVGSEENGIQSKDLGELRQSDHTTESKSEISQFPTYNFSSKGEYTGIGIRQMDSFT